MVLNPTQQAYVDGVPFNEARAEVAQYFAAGADVFIRKQKEVGEASPYALTVANTDFWIGCFESPALAAEAARRLGLNLVSELPLGPYGQPVVVQRRASANAEDGGEWSAPTDGESRP